MAHRITLIPGGGTGPEIVEAARRVLEATGVEFDWDAQESGVDGMEKYGAPLPETTLESIRRNKIALKGPITTPIGTGFRSINVALRQLLTYDLKADRDDPTAVGTSRFADAIIEKLEASKVHA